MTTPRLQDVKGEPTVVRLDEIGVAERRRKDYGDVEQLAKEIKDQGLIQPICIMVLAEPQGQYRYKLLAGGRRMAACRLLKWEEIQANVYPFIEDERFQRLIELKENIARLDLSWQERAALTRDIHQNFIDLEGRRFPGQKEGKGWTIADTAQFMGMAEGTVKQELVLAAALEERPEIATNPNRSTAVKKIVKGAQHALEAERIARLQKATKKSSLDELRESLCNAYRIGDSLEAMRSMAEGSIDHVMIDPPYGIDLKFKMDMSADQVEELYGQRQIDVPAFLNFIRETFQQANRIMKKDGWLFCWLALEPWYGPFMNLLREAGFRPALPLLWVKNEGNTRAPSQLLANAYEPCIYARKGEIALNRRGVLHVFQHKLLSGDRPLHPTEKPIELLTAIYSTFLFPNTTVFVPFLGSGNDILAALNAQCTAFGYDISDAYKEAYKIRVYSAEPGKYTSYGA